MDLRELRAGEIVRRWPWVSMDRLAFALADDSSDDAVVVLHDAFDSENFDLKIGRVAEAAAHGAAGYAELLGVVRRRTEAMGYDQLLRRTSTNSLEEIWALGHAGYELMDVGVTFARALDEPIEVPGYDDLVVRLATDKDLDEIIPAMVADPWGGRYDADPMYPDHKVQGLRDRWLRNSLHGRADAVLVGEMEGRPAGYVTCLLDDQTGEGEIDLVGTVPEFRGRRVAGRVLQHAVAWFSTRTRFVTVRTQANNFAATALYEKGGFTLYQSDLTFRLAV